MEIEEVRRQLQGHLVDEAGTEAGGYALSVARFVPLLEPGERESLWLPLLVRSLPAGLTQLSGALLGAAPSERPLLAEALESVLRESDSASQCLSDSVAANVLCSLPNRVANALDGAVSNFFRPAKFYAWLSRLLAREQSFEHLAETVARLVTLAQGDSLAKAWAQELQESDFSDRLPELLLRVPRFERLLSPLLAHCSVVQFLPLASGLLEDDAARQQLETGLLCLRVLPARQARLLTSVHCLRGPTNAQSVARGLAAVWCEAYFIHHADYLVQRQVTCALAHLLRAAGDSGTRDTLPLLLEGVHGRMASPDAQVRRLGMALAQAASGATEGVAPLKFENQEGLAEVLEWESEPVLESSQLNMMDEDEEEDNAQQEDLEAPMMNLFGANDNSGDDDDDDSLSSYDVDEEPVETSMGPVYLRDCLNCLHEGRKDAEKQSQGLRAAASLVRAKPADLGDVAGPLMSALLHAHDEFNFANFSELRHAGVVALMVCAGASVVEAVGGEFCARNWTIPQRLGMLTAVHDAATELSGSSPSLKTPGAVDMTPPPPKDSLQSLLEIVPNDKSRRWGSAVQRPVVKSRRNLLVPVMGSYFWPFQNALQASAVVDVLVLARLLLYLGKIIALAPLCEMKSRTMRAYAEGIWLHRWSRDSHVVKSAMVGLIEALLSFTPQELLSDWDNVVDEAVQWYTGAARDGVDRETSEVARACAAELSFHISELAPRK